MQRLTGIRDILLNSFVYWIEEEYGVKDGALKIFRNAEPYPRMNFAVLFNIQKLRGNPL